MFTACQGSPDGPRAGQSMLRPDSGSRTVPAATRDERPNADSSVRVDTDHPRHPVQQAPTDRPYVLVLGTAQDGGLPQLGSRHRLDELAIDDPRRRRTVASLLLCDPRSGKRWLFDATTDLVNQWTVARHHPAVDRPVEPTGAASAGRGALFDGVFLTHAHMGHYAGLLHFGREAHASRRQPVFASQRMCTFLEENAPWNLLVTAEHIALSPLRDGEKLELADDLSVTAFSVPHRAEFTDTYGYRIEGPHGALLYIPDIDKWERWDRSIEAELRGVDYALLDGTFFADGEIPGRSMADIPHPFIQESLRRLDALPTTERSKVWFTHMNHTNPATDPAGEAARVIDRFGAHVAREGVVLEL